MSYFDFSEISIADICADDICFECRLMPKTGSDSAERLCDLILHKLPKCCDISDEFGGFNNCNDDGCGKHELKTLLLCSFIMTAMFSSFYVFIYILLRKVKNSNWTLPKTILLDSAA